VCKEVTGLDRQVEVVGTDASVGTAVSIFPKQISSVDSEYYVKLI
jgi:hypothetical protein